MTRLGGILLVAGCLFGIPQSYAQELPAGLAPGHRDELSFKAHSAAQALLFKELEPFSLQWLREEVNPLLRARRQLRKAMQLRAEQQRSVIAVPQAPERNFGKEVGIWRMSIGNTSTDNWSSFPDRMLDARTLRFPMRRDSRADKRTEQQKALDRMRQQNK